MRVRFKIGDEIMLVEHMIRYTVKDFDIENDSIELTSGIRREVTRYSITYVNEMIASGSMVLYRLPISVIENRLRNPKTDREM